MLEINDLEVYYGAIQALHGLSLTVGQGEIVTLIGGNGAGKSTTLRTVSGIIKPKRGSIRFLGQDITGFPPHQIVRLGISQSPEGRRVFADQSVMENLRLGAYIRQNAAEIEQDMSRVFNLFPRLKERARQKAGTLSGGEQQMLAIGRALMSRPKLLLLDEPSLGLAPLLVCEILAIMREVVQGGTTILLVEQNARQALAIADRGYVIETGKIVLCDSADNLLASELVRKAYLGE